MRRVCWRNFLEVLWFGVVGKKNFDGEKNICLNDNCGFFVCFGVVMKKSGFAVLLGAIAGSTLVNSSQVAVENSPDTVSSSICSWAADEEAKANCQQVMSEDVVRRSGWVILIASGLLLIVSLLGRFPLPLYFDTAAKRVSLRIKTGMQRILMKAAEHFDQKNYVSIEGARNIIEDFVVSTKLNAELADDELSNAIEGLVTAYLMFAAAQHSDRKFPLISGEEEPRVLVAARDLLEWLEKQNINGKSDGDEKP